MYSTLESSMTLSPERAQLHQLSPPPAVVESLRTISPPPPSQSTSRLTVKSSSSPTNFASSSNLYNLDTATAASVTPPASFLHHSLSHGQMQEYSALHPVATHLDMHDMHNNNNSSRIDNNLAVPAASSYNGCATFTPSPSSDSHCESPTTPTTSQASVHHPNHQYSTLMDLNVIKSRDDCNLTPPNSASLHLHRPPAPNILPDGYEAKRKSGEPDCLQPFAYNMDQIDCICDSLQQRGDFKTLESFLHTYSTDLNSSTVSESVLRGKAMVAFENGNFRELYSIIESRDFSQTYHTPLQELWYRAHYKEAESVRGRPLGEFAKKYRTQQQEVSVTFEFGSWQKNLLIWQKKGFI